jgi:hypothetical protein
MTTDSENPERILSLQVPAELADKITDALERMEDYARQEFERIRDAPKDDGYIEEDVDVARRFWNDSLRLTARWGQVQIGA